jgi:hypothetical protein
MKLPSGTLKNWNHVVDARSGPGIKSMVRGKGKVASGGSLNASKQLGGDCSENDLTPEKPILKRKHVYRPKTSNIRINKDIRNNNISSLSKVKHPKKQPIENIRRLKGDALRKNLFSNLSMEERHKQRREGAGEFLDETMWKKQKNMLRLYFHWSQWRGSSGSSISGAVRRMQTFKRTSYPINSYISSSYYWESTHSIYRIA